MAHLGTDILKASNWRIFGLRTIFGNFKRLLFMYESSGSIRKWRFRQEHN